MKKSLLLIVCLLVINNLFSQITLNANFKNNNEEQVKITHWYSTKDTIYPPSYISFSQGLYMETSMEEFHTLIFEYNGVKKYLYFHSGNIPLEANYGVDFSNDNSLILSFQNGKYEESIVSKEYLIEQGLYHQ